MPDAATWSVIGSSTVAVASLATAAIGARSQRQHEVKQAREERMWAAKTSALHNLIGAAWPVAALEPLVDSAPHWDEVAQLAEAILRLRTVMRDEAPGIEAYASAKCRDELIRTNVLLIETFPDGGLLDDCAALPYERRHKEEAIDARDFEAAARYRDHERETLARIATASRDTDWKAVVARCGSLMAAARASIQGGES
ncbi:hypothetical protein [Yimella sp. NH-Cas1]|uniref:hypothetical protein n=1 Tax=Yimella sp. NH-Cas1 TaxID=2917726 RepID=UPI001EFB3A50|nr:hypothetical protein [Yimella sp. NH-Cas1]MCG8653998.1 hypothetical protein [Yimella sp. NH-Cas1]